MTENAKTFPPMYNADDAKGPGEDGQTTGGSDWSGRGRKPNEADQQNGQSWLGGPQNGDETPGESAAATGQKTIQEPTEASGNVQGVDTQTGSQAKGDGDATKVGSAYWQ